MTSNRDCKSDSDSLDSFDPASKVIVWRFRQLIKQKAKTISIDEGIENDSSDEQSPNADTPKCETVEPGSNVTFESFLQKAKHEVAMVLTDEGMQIDRSDRQ
jgi:hypothetical protein